MERDYSKIAGSEWAACVPIAAAPSWIGVSSQDPPPPAGRAEVALYCLSVCGLQSSLSIGVSASFPRVPSESTWRRPSRCLQPANDYIHIYALDATMLCGQLSSFLSSGIVSLWLVDRRRRPGGVACLRRRESRQLDRTQHSITV